MAPSRGTSRARRSGERATETAARGPSDAPWGLALVLVSTLLAQGLVIYTYQHVVLGTGFYPVTFAARVLVPLVVGLGLLRLRPAELGLALPRLTGAQWGLLAAVVVGIPLVAVPLLEMESYRAAYAFQRRETPELADAIARFAAFTISTTLPWEILHRAFLLHAARLLLLRNGLSAAAAASTAIAITLCFEVLFHFVKPPLEALALALGSPALSWLAFRTRSVLVPVLLHLEVELLFFWIVLR